MVIEKVKIYLVWEIESSYDYGVVKVFDEIGKAEEWIRFRDKMTGNHYRIEEKEVE